MFGIKAVVCLAVLLLEAKAHEFVASENLRGNLSVQDKPEVPPGHAKDSQPGKGRDKDDQDRLQLTSNATITSCTSATLVDSKTCSSTVWERDATDHDGPHTCGSRIGFLKNHDGLSLHDSCEQVANEFPKICPCNPNFCKSFTCTADVWERGATAKDETYSCGARIKSVRDDQGKTLEEACEQVSSEFPQVCTCNPTPSSGLNPPCSVQIKTVHVDQNYECGNPTKKTKVYYPDPNKARDVQGDFPVVMYHRASDGWNNHPDGYDKWLTSMAEQCLIVIAPVTDGFDSGCYRDQDLIKAYDYAKNNWKSWGIPATPNFGVVGAGGHSSGAHHVPKFQEDFHKKYSLKVSAAMYSHGGGSRRNKTDLQKCLQRTNSPCKNVPALFLSSRGDDLVYPTDTLEWYDLMTPVTDHAIFAEVATGGHMEPLETGRLNDYTGRFFACHLYGEGGSTSHSVRKREACSWLYGTHPHICGRIYQLDSKGDCRVKQPKVANIAAPESG